MAGIACVTINYRNPEDTLACLASLRLPGAEGFKVFLVNNHASDGSGETLQRYLRESGLAFAYLDPGKNTGFTGEANLGVGRPDVLDRRGQNSAPVLRWLALAGLIGSLANIPYAFIEGIGRPDITARLHLIMPPCYLLALWWLIGIYGIEGAAMVWAARATGTLLLLKIAQRVLLALTPLIRRLAPALAVTLIAFIVEAMIKGGLIAKGLFVLFTMFLFVPTAWWLLFTREDRASVYHLIKVKTK